MTFKELHISEPVLQALEEKKYTEPTPIQEQAIPAACTGKDILGLAQTGTGKTCAFAIPLLEQLSKKANSTGRRQDRRPIKALILTPTRELAIQIEEDFTAYGKYLDLRHTVIFGGVKQTKQVAQLQKGVDILTATPGRLLDLINQGLLSLSNIEHFVLDEADRMLDMGFIHDIKKILPMLPKQKQTMLFSATMPDDIISIVKTLLHSPVKVEVAPVSSVVDTIEQHIYYVEKPDKVATLVNLIRERSDESMLVFSRTKHGADKIARVLCKNGIYCSAIHGNKSQNARQKALSDFKSGKTKVIIATDIAARGIDIKDLSIVVNYDLPDVPETYVHRIGRTGRAGHSGVAFTFCTQEEYPMMRRIQKLTGQKIDAISVGVDKDHPVIDDTNRSDERSEQRRPNNRQGNRSNNRQDSRSNSHRDNRQDHRSDSRSGGQQHQEKRSNNRQERHYSNASKSRSNGNAHRESATSRTAR